jgi:hypothetical protein
MQQTSADAELEPSSFRDPAGFVFRHEGVLYRQINKGHDEGYRALMDSGLYDQLAGTGRLVAHDEVPLRPWSAPDAAVVLRPALVPFISYPYEWSFHQLRDAALLTLEVQDAAVQRGCSLRDASAYNVQFVGRRPTLIDTLSIGAWPPGRPWDAYRQFCSHFLLPLALMSYGHPACGRLGALWMDGIPLDVGRHLLPLRSWLRPGLAMHLHAHGRAQAATGTQTPHGTERRHPTMSATAMRGLVDSLRRAVERVPPPRVSGVWSEYGTTCNYSEAATAHKRALVEDYLIQAGRTAPLRCVWDVGANTGAYSELAAGHAEYVVSMDLEPSVVDRIWTTAARGRDNILPLVQDLTNPSPALGWRHSERQSLVERGPADAVLALAVVHHLAIGGNVPLPQVAAFFRSICRALVVEFVPKEDSQVRRMLAVREDVFPTYSREGFEAAFAAHFDVLRADRISDSVRTLYLMSAR